MAAVLKPIQWLGKTTLGTFRGLAEVFSLLYGSLVVMLFTRTRGLKVVFEVGVTQTLFTGVHGLPIVSLASLAMGTLIITQANLYLGSFGVDAAAVAAHVLARDVIPLMVAIVLLGRSGTAICVELASMKLSGELDAIRSMGLALEHYIVLPRLIAGVVSALTLTIYGLAIGIGFGFGLSKAVGSLPFALEALINPLDRHDIIETLAKACLFGAGIVLVSIREGFSVQVSTREIPQATTRAVVRSMALVLVLNSVISIFF